MAANNSSFPQDGKLSTTLPNHDYNRTLNTTPATTGAARNNPNTNTMGGPDSERCRSSNVGKNGSPGHCFYSPSVPGHVGSFILSTLTLTLTLTPTLTYFQPSTHLPMMALFTGRKFSTLVSREQCTGSSQQPKASHNPGSWQLFSGRNPLTFAILGGRTTFAATAQQVPSPAPMASTLKTPF